MNINNFLDLSFSTRSENTVIFRYFKNIPGMEQHAPILNDYPDGPQNNPIVDLFDSFNFSDESRRRRSGFKLKNFNLRATHNLGDWNAVLGVTMSPYLPHGANQYRINTDFSFLVQWVPISEIKTDITYEGIHQRYRVR
jgi:hypothetical protein